MNKEQRKKLESASQIGKPVYFTDKETGEQILWGIVEDEVYIMVSDYKHMIQRMVYPKGETWSGKKDAYWDGSKFGYRSCYYTYDKNMEIQWGQYTQFLTEYQYREILGKARAKGWPIL